MPMFSRIVSASIALAGLLLLACPLHADEVAQAGRAIVAKAKDSLVTVTVVAKISVTAEGETTENEEKDEVTGVVIDPSGLILVSLMSADPVEAINSMVGGLDEGVKVTADVTDMRILFTDGTELPGKIVLRDKDLDLAFIRPTKAPAKPLTAIDLSKASTPELLDQVMLMYRLGTVANRTLNVTVDRIEAIIEKPRKEYILGAPGFSCDIGSPVYSLDGGIVGVLLGKPTANIGGGDDQGSICIVLPAEEIAEAVTHIDAKE